jgi:hypothetical protein
MKPETKAEVPGPARLADLLPPSAAEVRRSRKERARILAHLALQLAALNDRKGRGNGNG